jgi:hypothetical protein
LHLAQLWVGGLFLYWAYDVAVVKKKILKVTGWTVTILLIGPALSLWTISRTGVEFSVVIGKTELARYSGLYQLNWDSGNVCSNPDFVSENGLHWQRYDIWANWRSSIAGGNTWSLPKPK